MLVQRAQCPNLNFMAKNKRMVEFNGRTLSVGQWSKELGIAHGTLTNRLDAGWTATRALSSAPDPVFSTKSRSKITKNEAELMLNELTYSQQPAIVKNLIKETEVRQMQGFPKQAKYGEIFRRKFPRDFAAWFEKSFSTLSTKNQ